MSSNGVGLTESIVHARRGSAAGYQYRNSMGMIPSYEYLVFFDDFLQKVTTNVPTGWSAAVIDTSATATQGTTAGSLDATGGLKIAGGGSASQGASIYLPKAVQLTSAKKFFVEVKVQTDVAAETDIQFGLSDLTATTNPEDLWTTTAANLVTFGTLAGSAYPSMLSDKTNSGTSAQTQSTLALSNTTWAVLGIGFDGTNLRGYVNGSLALTWSGASTTIPTGVALAPFIGARCGATAGNTVTFDYFRFVIER